MALRSLAMGVARGGWAGRAAGAARSRSLRTMSFGGTEEEVTERADFPTDKIQKIFADDKFAVIGYGVQGRAQSMNMRDSGLDGQIVIGLREGGPSWKLAESDGWVPGETLLPIADAAAQGSVIMYLLSDAGQKASWSTIQPHLTSGKSLYFSHGFSVTYKDDTGVIPPEDVDVFLCAPKGSGTTVRSLFLEGRGINSSVAIHQDVSGNARERAFALGVAIGSGYLYETDFKKEVYSDLTGERGTLMGAIQGLFLAQYEVLRENGHSPSEAFNETVEEATQSLYPLIAKNGMDWMYANCSTTAQRGALDWYPKFYAASKPVFAELYSEVANGNEARRTLDCNSKPTYAEDLEKELAVLREHEMWSAGRIVRELRPENQK
eukprot:m.460385 g.460385  ORF g.460385 m.460385 type:complete len:379 (-) comp22014_c0_seq1:117-1253(-)